jgi:hypothetical protein
MLTLSLYPGRSFKYLESRALRQQWEDVVAESLCKQSVIMKQTSSTQVNIMAASVTGFSHIEAPIP